MVAERCDMDDRRVLQFNKDCRSYKLGAKYFKSEIKGMRYHAPNGEGDKHFIDVYLTDMKSVRVL